MNIFELFDRINQYIIILSVTIHFKCKLIKEVSFRQFQNSLHTLIHGMDHDIIKFSQNKYLFPVFRLFRLIREKGLIYNITDNPAVFEFQTQMLLRKLLQPLRDKYPLHIFHLRILLKELIP